jgi:hypothetical protein
MSAHSLCGQILVAHDIWQERDGHAQFYPAEPRETIRVQQYSHAGVCGILPQWRRRAMLARMGAILSTTYRYVKKMR